LKRWSTREVARIAGVSPATVSRVLNNSGNVGPELVNKVMAVVRTLEGGGQPGAGAQSSRKVAVAFPRRLEGYDSDPMGGSFYGQVLSGIHEVLRESGHDPSFFPYDPADDSVGDQLNRFDGVILMGADTPNQLARNVHVMGLPVVVIDKEVRGVDSVVSDNVGGTEEVTAHVLSQGYRHLLYLCETLEDPSFAARRQGFEQAISAAGLPDVTVQIAELGRGWLDAPAVLANLEANAQWPVAVVAGNDMTALHLLALARAKGLSVPDQLAVAGFDDVNLASRAEPPLTTVRVDKTEMGRLAAWRLIERMRQPGLLPITITMHVALMVRASTNLGETRSR
jgi:DNA-binding LacI/PurR family transcriptional regulator